MLIHHLHSDLASDHGAELRRQAALGRLGRQALREQREAAGLDISTFFERLLSAIWNRLNPARVRRVIASSLPLGRSENERKPLPTQALATGQAHGIRPHRFEPQSSASRIVSPSACMPVSICCGVVVQ